MSTPEPRIYIVDDDEAIRDSLRFLFRSRGYQAATFDSGEAFLDVVDCESPGCVLLDVRMSGMSGLELFDRLAQRRCRLPVIFLTGHGDVPMAVGALKGGAYDFMEKPFNDNELVDRVARCLADDARRRELRARQDSISARLALLTTREREVMDLILAGKANKLIADELAISMRTVEVHRARVLEKMGVKTAVELAQLVAGADTGE